MSYHDYIRRATDNIRPSTRPDKYPYIIHAEQNLIYNCARRGISTLNSTLYCTMSPCVICTRALWNSGITRVVAKEKYKDFDKLHEMKDIFIKESPSPNQME